jgi:hypothetical protein
MLGAATEMVTVEVAVSVKYVPVMVNVWAAIAFSGVPEITPVVVFKVSPAGRVPVTEYVGVPLNSAGVKAVVGVIAVPGKPEMVCVAGEMVKGTHCANTVVSTAPSGPIEAASGEPPEEAANHPVNRCPLLVGTATERVTVSPGRYGVFATTEPP